MGSLLYLLLYLGCFVQLVTAGRFMVTAPSVFHVGVKEHVSIQVGKTLLGKSVTCHLENEVGRILVSNTASETIDKEGNIKIIALEVLPDEFASLPSVNAEVPYLNLVCDVGEIKRAIARVLVSQHRGYIFIQTSQPLYNPTQEVQYRIFTLDHSMRPISSRIHVYIINADGNTIKKMLINVNDGIYSSNFLIPDVSEPGIWKIKAYYQGDEDSPTSQEFKVQKFVLPSFVVTIDPEADILLISENVKFSISALYSYGKKINGGFHCRFGLRQKESNEIKFLKGLEQIGPIQDGKAEITIKISDIQQKLINGSLEKLAKEEAQFYIATTVTDTLSGEVQESEVSLPILSQKYKVDLSRTRSYFIPKVPFDARVVVRTPNGVPVKGVPVSVNLLESDDDSKTIKTNDKGEVHLGFNIKETSSLTVEVTVDGYKSTKKIFPATSSNGNFLHIRVSKKILSPGEQLDLTFNVINGKPEDEHIYYLILSKGALIKAGSLKAMIVSEINLLISSDMIPSFRLIGYYYDTNGEIIADSVWVDVKDVCNGKLEVTEKDAKDSYFPGQAVDLKIDVEDQRNVKVALLAVDKAIYALNAQNKLTPKQVFTAMLSYDLGCSYGGGQDIEAVFNDAGLSFISHSQTVRSRMRKGFGCESGFRRQRRSIDVQTEMVKKETEYSDEGVRKCCRHGLMLIPMLLTCEERKKRISKTETAECVGAFLECCEFAAKLRENKRKEDMRNTQSRTTGSSTVEDFFDNEIQYIRRSFPPSFGFTVINVNQKTEHKLYLPDSITTWEIQALSMSFSHGFCVADPLPIRVFQELFISMKLPYSVKPNEQMAIVVVIHNYGKRERQLAVHMKQVDGLCSPGTSSSNSFVNITLNANSAETVTFSAVPLKNGEIPITVQLYDTEYEEGVDSIQKTLFVMPEGVQMQKEKTYPINLDGRNDITFTIDGDFPNSTVPGSVTNLFVKIEGAYSTEEAVQLLSPDKVKNLVRAPYGCAEQTMITVSPTALAIRYLDYTNRWLELPTDTRDKALDYIKKGYERILTFKKKDGSYGAWTTYPSSTWLTALVVKVLSLVATCQSKTGEKQEIVSQLEIRASVNHLIKQQMEDGSFKDPHPVIHREMQGGIGGVEEDVSLTAFITIALNHSLPYLDWETTEVKSNIFRATEYLLSRVQDLKRPFSVAITAYCLSTCLEDRKKALPAWNKLKSLGVQEGECKVWRDSADLRLKGEGRTYLVPSEVALTVETTAYALLTALEHNDFEEAKMAACFLSSQENYEGGFKSTQDTIMALEALSEYKMRKPEASFTTVNVQFTTPKRKEKENLTINKKNEKNEAELKRLLGSDVIAKVSGKGEAKIKVVKAYYAKNPFTSCDQLSINVTVEGKIEYSAHILDTYNYFDYSEDEETSEEEDFPHSAIEWFDARTRYRRDTEKSLKSENEVMYTVCVSYSLGQANTGMAIADITLLSGFEPIKEDLDKLKDLADKYISHYEVSKGRVLLYFNEIPDVGECIAFEAKQTVPIGLLQPAPAYFYDYYEPDRKCSVFYAAPKRSKMVSVLCSGEVCECAERACFKEKKGLSITKKDRLSHACYQPVADYGFMVDVISVEDVNNFELYTTNITEVLKSNKDIGVGPGDIRVFAKRKHCKVELKKGQIYLIMGNDGSTKDSRGLMLYLLDSNTWIEQKPTNCKATNNKSYCKGFKEFRSQYLVNGCQM